MSTAQISSCRDRRYGAAQHRRRMSSRRPRSRKSSALGAIPCRRKRAACGGAGSRRSVRIPATAVAATRPIGTGSDIRRVRRHMAETRSRYRRAASGRRPENPGSRFQRASAPFRLEWHRAPVARRVALRLVTAAAPAAMAGRMLAAAAARSPRRATSNPTSKMLRQAPARPRRRFGSPTCGQAYKSGGRRRQPAGISSLRQMPPRLTRGRREVTLPSARFLNTVRKG